MASLLTQTTPQPRHLRFHPPPARMGLRLHHVPARQGWQWVRQGFALWFSRPLAFIGLFTFFLMTILLLAMLLPVVGGLMGLALMPMLTLGYMVASRSALAGGQVHPLQLVQGLRHADPAQRRAQWLLCAGYMLGSVIVIWLAQWVDGGAFDTLMRAMSEREPGKPSPETAELMADPRLAWGMAVRVGLAGLLSVPFWHAPALVQWGGQSALQALFSSGLALWRARAAFTVYLLGWLVLMMGAGVLLSVLAAVTGAGQVLGLLAVPLGLVFSAAFYTSLWFSFNDSFGLDELKIAP